MSTALDESPVVHIKTRHKPTYSDLAHNIEPIEKLGKWIAQSKFFGCENESQGCVIAADCFLTGMTLIEYQRRNKIVAGKPFKQYDAMLAEFHERGGKSLILQSTSEVASIEFTFNDHKQTVTLTWEELQKEPVPYAVSEKEYMQLIAAGKTPPLKAKYATPRSRQTMLIARLISASIRVICPEVNYGTYTEEESLDIVDAESVSVVTATADRDESRKRAIEAKSNVEMTTGQKNMKAIEDAEPTREGNEEPDYAPGGTRNTSKLIASESGPQSASLNDPASEQQTDQIKGLIAESMELGQKDIKDRIVAKLKATGIDKLANLTIVQADLLITALMNRNVSMWLDASLERCPK